MTTYTVLLAPDPSSGGYTLTAPALPGCVSQGETVDKCLDNAERVIRRYLDDQGGSGEPVCDPVVLRVLALASRDEAPQLHRAPFTRVVGPRAASGPAEVR